MTRSARRRWPAVAVIVYLAAACDNVRWGGIEVRLEPPPPVRPTPGTAPAPEPPPPPVPTGTVVFAVDRDGDDGTAHPVAALEGDTLVPVTPAGDPEAFGHRFWEVGVPERELALFADGVRVGTLVVEETVPVDEAVCPPRPAARGVVETVAGAAGTDRFLGLPEGRAGDRRHGPFRPPAARGADRSLTFRTAVALVRERGAPSPGSWIRARVDLRRLRPAPGEELVAATYLHRDALGTSPPVGDAWALFFLAAAGDGPPAYVRFRRYSPDGGKAVPRLYDHLDLDGDGTDELVLEVFGVGSRWFTVLRRGGRGWRAASRDPCPAADAPGAAPGGAAPG